MPVRKKKIQSVARSQILLINPLVRGNLIAVEKYALSLSMCDSVLSNRDGQRAGVLWIIVIPLFITSVTRRVTTALGYSWM